ncbi:MAG: hypothetical protein II747_04820 [Clostridia bacterium]|nr:hypothetical protein [Clostridia bacterium]
MKKIPIFFIMSVIAFLFGCTNAAYHIQDIVEIKDEQPICVIVHFDDPSITPLEIDDKNDIERIVQNIEERSYEKISSDDLAPLGNTSCELRYSDGSSVEFGAVYVTDKNGVIYKADSNDLAFMLEGLSPTR